MISRAERVVSWLYGVVCGRVVARTVKKERGWAGDDGVKERRDFNW
jgi:hypothetical protein